MSTEGRYQAETDRGKHSDGEAMQNLLQLPPGRTSLTSIFKRKGLLNMLKDMS